MRTLILPSANRRDFDELHVDVKAGCEVHFVDSYQQVFEIVFEAVDRVAAAAAAALPSRDLQGGQARATVDSDAAVAAATLSGGRPIRKASAVAGAQLMSGVPPCL